MKNKNINNCSDIKFIYPSNRSALSYTDLKKTTKSSQILWMMHQKRVKTLFIRIMEKYIYAEVRLSQCGFFCDILVWLFMCEIRACKHNTVKKRTLGMLKTNASIDRMQPVVVQHLWTTVYGLNFAYLELWLLFQVHLCTFYDQSAIHVYLCFL